MGVVHRDLKPESILLVKENSFEHLKISQFDISKIISNPIKNASIGTSKEFLDKDNMMNTMCGTLSYTAPEILKGKPYDYRIDLWSLGVIMYILFCGYPPFFGNTDNEIVHSIVKDCIEFEEDDWKHVSNEAKQIIKGLLEKDPSKRMSCDDIINYTNGGKVNTDSKAVTT